MHAGTIGPTIGRDPRGPQTTMHLFLLLFAVTLGSTPAAARSSQASPAQDAPSSDLPVSIERIRELLARAPAESVLVGLERQPDYKLTVEERRFLKDILESLDVKTAPPPPGGLYTYEMQQQVWNTRNSPLRPPVCRVHIGRARPGQHDLHPGNARHKVPGPRGHEPQPNRGGKPRARGGPPSDRGVLQREARPFVHRNLQVADASLGSPARGGCSSSTWRLDSKAPLISCPRE